MGSRRAGRQGPPVHLGAVLGVHCLVNAQKLKLVSLPVPLRLRSRQRIRPLRPLVPTHSPHSPVPFPARAPSTRIDEGRGEGRGGRTSFASSAQSCLPAPPHSIRPPPTQELQT
eukprot:300118-Rhodomonas_salina.2